MASIFLWSPLVNFSFGGLIMNAVAERRSLDLVGSARAGAMGGIVGGILFGIMMASMGMLPMVGMLVGSESAIVGFIVHILISIIFGGIYGAVMSRFVTTFPLALGSGAVNGVVWWVLGALIMMPLMLGMTQMVFVVGEMQWMSLLGHLIYGVATGVVYFLLVKGK
jgi:hypothetical protein